MQFNVNSVNMSTINALAIFLILFLLVVYHNISLKYVRYGENVEYTGMKTSALVAFLCSVAELDRGILWKGVILSLFIQRDRSPSWQGELQEAAAEVTRTKS